VFREPLLRQASSPLRNSLRCSLRLLHRSAPQGSGTVSDVVAGALQRFVTVFHRQRMFSCTHVPDAASWELDMCVYAPMGCMLDAMKASC